MAGGMFSGHDQCEGDIIERNGKKYKLFYGMSSSTAMDKHAGMIYKQTQIFFYLFEFQVELLNTDLQKEKLSRYFTEVT